MLRACPKCGGRRWSRRSDLTLNVCYDDMARIVEPTISDFGTSNYIPICNQCGSLVELKDMVAQNPALTKD